MNQLNKLYLGRKKEIEKRLNDFSKIKGDQLFYELCFCLLTPQSNAFRSDEKIKILMEKDFLNKKIDPHPIIKDLRFHNNRNKYLKELKQNYPKIKKILNNGYKSEELRDILIKNVKGISMKESSHFLRNTGHRNLAILDRHILKNLHRYMAIEELPKTMTPKKYLEIEQRFLGFSKREGIPMDELDLLFWS